MQQSQGGVQHYLIDNDFQCIWCSKLTCDWEMCVCAQIKAAAAAKSNGGEIPGKKKLP